MTDHQKDPTGRTDRGNQNDEDLGSSSTRGGGSANIDKDEFGDPGRSNDPSRSKSGRSGPERGLRDEDRGRSPGGEGGRSGESGLGDQSGRGKQPDEGLSGRSGTGGSSGMSGSNRSGNVSRDEEEETREERNRGGSGGGQR